MNHAGLNKKPGCSLIPDCSRCREFALPIFHMPDKRVSTNVNRALRPLEW